MKIDYVGPYDLERATEGSAGYDLRTMDCATIEPNSSFKFSTGLKIAIPHGYVGIIKARSGLSFKNSVENGAGIIDSDYRGIIKMHLYNLGKFPVSFEAGDKVAQILIQKHETPEFVRVDSLDETARGENGFGSTGIK
jgi:dUTP pyrophosphatase